MNSNNKISDISEIEEIKQSEPMIVKSKETFSYPLIDNLNETPQIQPIQQSPQVHPPSQAIQSQFSSLGVPQAQIIQNGSNQENLAKFQNHVQKNAKCIRFFGIALMIMGGMSIAGNMLFLTAVEQFSKIYWTDTDGQLHKFQFDQIGIYHITIIKILICALFFRQGNLMNKVVKPILKEYQDAQAGRSHGIIMSERKSKKILELRLSIQRLTALAVLVIAITFAYVNSWLEDQVDKFIDEYYFIQQNNSDFSDFESDSVVNNATSLYLDDSEPVYINRNKHIKENDQISEQEQAQQIEQPQEFEQPLEIEQPQESQEWFEDHDHDDHHRGNKPGHFKIHDHGKHHRNHNQMDMQYQQPNHQNEFSETNYEVASCSNILGMTDEKILDWMSTADKYLIKDCTQNAIESSMIFSFLFTIVFLIGFQQYYIILCTRMAKNQKILEDKFMGPEMISQNQAGRGQVTPQPVIQYIAVPQHFAQQYPSYVQPQQVISTSINHENQMI